MSPADAILMVLSKGPSTFSNLEREAINLGQCDRNRLVSALNGLVVSKRVEWDPARCIYQLTGKGPEK